MAQYNLTVEQITGFDYNFNMFMGRFSKMVAGQIIPWVDKPVALGTEFYMPVRPQRPTTGKMFATEAQRTVQYEELTAKSCSCWMDLEIPDVEMKILAQTPGMSIENSHAKVFAHQMAMQIAYNMYMGDTATEMTGLFGAAGATSTYNTVKWNAATGPHLTINDMIFTAGSLQAEGFEAPYTLVLSDNLEFGTNVTISATPVADITNGDMMMNLVNGSRSGDKSNLFYEDIGTNNATGTRIYPIETATAEDGRAILMKPVQNGEWYVRGVWFQRPHSTGWTFDPKTDRWHTRMKAMYTLEVKDADAVVGHTTVDLA